MSVFFLYCFLFEINLFLFQLFLKLVFMLYVSNFTKITLKIECQSIQNTVDNCITNYHLHLVLLLLLWFRLSVQPHTRYTEVMVSENICGLCKKDFCTVLFDQCCTHADILHSCYIQNDAKRYTTIPLRNFKNILVYKKISICRQCV